MPLVGRGFRAGSGYRYGFNGKENDDEVKGEGNFQDYGMRTYDPRIQRFPNVDPLTKQYPELTPFQFASNTPVQAIDLDGGEAKIITTTIFTNSNGRTVISPLRALEVDNPYGMGKGKLFIHRFSGLRGVNDFDLFVYEPAAVAPKQSSLFDRLSKLFEKVNDGGAPDNGGANGSRSTQPFGFVFLASDDGKVGNTITGTGNEAQFFEVLKDGILGLIKGTGGGPSALNEKPELIIQKIAKSAEEFKQATQTYVDLDRHVKATNLSSAPESKKPKPHAIFVDPATRYNHKKDHQSIKTGELRDTIYFTEPERKN